MTIRDRLHSRIPALTDLNTLRYRFRARLHLSRGVRIALGAKVLSRYGGEIWLGDATRVDHGAYLFSQNGDIRTGENVYFGPKCLVYGGGGLTIGRNSGVGAQAVIIPFHHLNGRRDTPFREQGTVMKGVVIGEDVWIGALAVVLDGVSIGDGAVVAAGAVVNRDVAPFSVVGGVPARVLGSRGEE